MFVTASSNPSTTSASINAPSYIAYSVNAPDDKEPTPNPVSNLGIALLSTTSPGSNAPAALPDILIASLVSFFADETICSPIS